MLSANLWLDLRRVRANGGCKRPVIDHARADAVTAGVAVRSLNQSPGCVRLACFAAPTVRDAQTCGAMHSIGAVHRRSRGFAAIRRLVGMYVGSSSGLPAAAAAAAAFVQKQSAQVQEGQ